MLIDVDTILVLLIGTNLIAAAVMFAEWLRCRDIALAWFFSAFLALSMSAALLPLRFSSWGVPSLGAAIVLVLLGHGMLFSGVAAFCGRPDLAKYGVVGAAVWLVFWMFSPLADQQGWRLALSSSITAIYSYAGAHFLLRFATRSRLVQLVAGVFALRAAFSVARAIAAATDLDFAHPLLAGYGVTIVLMWGLWSTVLLGHLLLALTHESRESSLVRLAETDALTGADNRRAFVLKGEAIVAQSTSLEETALLMLDLDHFKQINDEHGHAFGDEILKEFAEIVRRHVGPTDSFARLGGEEFALLLPGGNAAVAATMAEAIRLDFESRTRGVTSLGRTATVSIGVATTRQAADLDELMKWADDALYLAKSKGRNRVEMITPAVRKAASSAIKATSQPASKDLAYPV